ncbi:MAG: AAA family ATPase [Crocinitomicaceae bacterium]|nr:AAA family ATPase [Crocinitomicaceae bacterium]
MISLAITGPESSGKTQLAEELAVIFSPSVLVEEFARSYMTEHHLAGRYQYNDVVFIADQQWKQTVLAGASLPEVLICDTEQLVMLIWIREVFGREDEAIKTRFVEESFDLYLLCAPDVPWEPDPLRENEYDRDRLFRIFESELQRTDKKYIVITGTGDARTRLAVAAIEKIQKSDSGA